jgi:proteasome assembly chaperone (PAC2) family protein
VRDQTGYELDGVSDQEIEREFEAGGETRTVIVTNKMAEHHKSVQLPSLGSDGEAAIFTALTTPQVDILGRNFNPVEDMSAKRIAKMVQEQYDSIAAPEEESSETVTINGEETTQTKFRADAQFEGSPVELFLHISEAVELGSDFVVTVGGYPTSLPDEEQSVLELMQSVEESG